MAGENSTSTEKIPNFSEPTTFISPQIANLIVDSNYVCEDGIAFLGNLLLCMGITNIPLSVRRSVNRFGIQAR